MALSFVPHIHDTVMEVNEKVAFELQVQVSLINSATFAFTGQPHFDMQLFVSSDKKYDREDLQVDYELTTCQIERMTKELTTTTTLDLSDKGLSSI